MAMFSPTKMKIFKIDQEIPDIFNKKRELLISLRNKHTAMLEAPLQDSNIFHQPQQQHQNQQKINNVFEINKTKDIVKYLCKSAFNPVPTTWIKSIRNVFFYNIAGPHRRRRP